VGPAIKLGLAHCHLERTPLPPASRHFLSPNPTSTTHIANAPSSFLFLCTAPAQTIFSTANLEPVIRSLQHLRQIAALLHCDRELLFSKNSNTSSNRQRWVKKRSAFPVNHPEMLPFCQPSTQMSKSCRSRPRVAFILLSTLCECLSISCAAVRTAC
jgi:hypothetical protein